MARPWASQAPAPLARSHRTMSIDVHVGPSGVLEDRTGRDPAPLGRDTARLRPGTRSLFGAFAALTALATNQLLLLGGHTDRFWPWTIQNRATVGFLGAAYAAGLLLSVLSLRQR